MASASRISRPQVEAALHVRPGSDNGAMTSLYDLGAGTGGMSSIAPQHVAEVNETVRLEVFGRKLNPQTQAVAKSDIIIKGERQERTCFGNALTDDDTTVRHFGYRLCKRWVAQVIQDNAVCEHELAT